MGDSKKRKFEMIVTMEEAAELLMQIARQMDQGALLIGETEVPLEGFRRLGVSLKHGEEGLRFKLKIKYLDGQSPGNDDEEDVEDEEDATLTPERPRYKTLKKRMDSTFKAICASLDSGDLPDKDAVHSFVRDAGLMAAYADKKDDCWHPEVASGAEELASGFAEGDMERMQAAVRALRELKNFCHHGYKEPEHVD